MRDPAIHVRRSDLIKILEDVRFSSNIGQLLDMADKIVVAGRKYSLKGRTHIELTKESKKKAERVVSATVEHTDLFNNILCQERLALSHKGLRPIKRTDSDYAMLSDIVVMAVEFHETFVFEDTRESFRIFIEHGLKFMGKRYGLNKFKYYKERIFSVYESSQLLLNDKNIEVTNALYTSYREHVMEAAKFDFKCIDDPEKYINFYYAAEHVDQLGCDPGAWITAQFMGLAFANAIPDLVQLHGDNALTRYQKYLFSIVPAATLPAGMVFGSKEEEEYYVKYLQKHDTKS